VEDYSQKYKGEHVELALFGGEYQDGVLTAYCLLEDVPHVELNGHISCRSRTWRRCTARAAVMRPRATGLRPASETTRPNRVVYERGR
jgi:hypothetical protein